MCLLRRYRWPGFIGALAVFVPSALAVAAAPDWMQQPSIFLGIPIGNLVAACMMAAAPLAALLLVDGGRDKTTTHTLLSKILVTIARAAMLAGFLWLPISMGMAGNIQLNNFGNAYGAFIALSAFCTLVPVMTMATWAVAKLLGRKP